jgi:hypothetical protein
MERKILGETMKDTVQTAEVRRMTNMGDVTAWVMFKWRQEGHVARMDLK